MSLTHVWLLLCRKPHKSLTVGVSSVLLLVNANCTQLHRQCGWHWLPDLQLCFLIWFTSWDFDGGILQYSLCYPHETLESHKMLCCRIVSNMEPALGICPLISSFHGFTDHLGVLGRLPSTWIGVWSLISHAWRRHPHFQFQFNSSPKVVSGSSLSFPVLLLNWHFLSLQSSHVPLSGLGHSERPVAHAQTSLPTRRSELEPKSHSDALNLLWVPPSRTLAPEK